MVARKKSKPADLVRVFVGTSPREQDAEACAVVEYGIQSRSSAPVEITWLNTDDYPGWQSPGLWQTPWTPLRWMVPELCGGIGRAVYFDCPTIVLGDVVALADAPFPDGAIMLAKQDGRTTRTGCIVFDCAAARAKLPSVAEMKADPAAHQAVGAVLDRTRDLVGPLPTGWGARDVDYSAAPSADWKSIHFPSPSTQPHARLAAARLNRRGASHWFTGSRLPHFSSDLTAMFNDELSNALERGAKYLVVGGAS